MGEEPAAHRRMRVARDRHRKTGSLEVEGARFAGRHSWADGADSASV